MAHLSLSLLGAFQATLDEEPVAGFGSAKARALLVYLAVESERPHRREMLTALLWPEEPERVARHNLRHVLFTLRKVVGDRDPSQSIQGESAPHLLITRETVQFSDASDCWVDVHAFQALLEADSAEPGAGGGLAEAVSLYRGPFLEGFSVRDSPTFEDWALVVRDRLQRQVSSALQRLVEADVGRGDYGRASEWAWRWVELAPWQEQAHQDLMRLLALSGQRGAALAQYEACRRALREELDVEPGEETARLYARIRDGELGPPRQEEVGAISAAPPAPFSSPPSSPPTGGTEGGLQGERRTVTALVAAVSGSTLRGEPIDVELRAEVMRHILPILGGEVERYGGEVDRYLDDGLVALFGASTAHEDDPERAVLAALAVGEAIGSYAHELAEREGTHLSLHVGVNTGEVIAASVGDRQRLWAEQVVEPAFALTGGVGHTAEQNTVLVTEGTYHLVAALFEWQAGTGEAAYRPLRHKALLGKGRGVEGLESPLVGRDAELQALQEALDRLRSGIGGIVTVVGEAGIGKSRLVAETRRTTDDERRRTDDGGRRSAVDGLTWVEGRCLSYATDAAYQIWLDMLRGLLGLAADTPLVAAANVLRERVYALCSDCANEVHPFLARMMSLPLTGSAEARLHGVEGEGLQVLTFRAVETLLSRAAAQRPLVVVCEDLHWADPTSLALLEHLLPLTDRVPLLLLCVFRPQTEHGCWQVRETAARDYRHRHTDLWLDPLTEEESAELVDHLLYIEDLPGALRAQILDRGEGNPFYVEEILRSLIDDGIITYDERGGRWQATQDVDDIPIPDTLHGVLAARIDRLPGETKRVLQLASVVGRIFTYPVLAAIYSPLPLGRSQTRSVPTREGEAGGEGERALDAHLLPHLVALERAQLIRERARLPEHEYAFKHVLTEEAAYGSLLRRERRAVHRRVAEALERLYPERVEEQLGLLAHHWEGAWKRDRAVACLRRAGEQAAAQYANEEAVSYFSRALALVPDAEMDTRYALLLARVRMYSWLEAREATVQDLLVLERLAEALDGPQGTRRRAQVALCQSNYLFWVGASDWAAATTAAQKAIRLAQTGEVDIEAEAYYLWGKMLWWHGQSTAAQPHLERAVALARTAGLRKVEADSLRDLGNALSAQGSHTEGRAYLEESLRISREIGDREGEAWVFVHLGLLAEAQGDYVQARACFERGLRTFREIGHRRGEGATTIDCGRISLALGDYAGARGWFEQGVHIGRGLASPLDTSVWLAWLGLLSHREGDDRAAQEYGQQALCIAQESDPGHERGYALTTLGHALAGLEEWDRAADAYRQFLDMLRELGKRDWAVLCLAGLAQVALAQGTCPEPVEGTLEQAQAYAEQILSHLEANPALYCTDEFSPYLRAIHEPLWIYLTCYRVLQASGDPRAREVLANAHTMLQERAAKIDDKALRRSYLENVPYHRELVALWEEMSHR